tara:strand:- start:2287 stop:2949 length:663 start_codon:yes stop_codon:yes gene_type:complete
MTPAAHAPSRLSCPTPPLDLATLLGPAAWQRLPAAVRRRFAAGHAPATYPGTLTMRCSTIGRVFAAGAALLGSPLCGARASAVPATVQVQADGCGGVSWTRRLQLPGRRSVQIRSTKALGPDGRLIERTDGGLGMALEVFEQHGALVFESRRYDWWLGRWRLPVPALLTPGTCRVTHEDLGQGRFRFTLEMRHAWWGRTFHQTGVFTDPPHTQTDQELLP